MSGVGLDQGAVEAMLWLPVQQSVQTTCMSCPCTVPEACNGMEKLEKQAVLQRNEK